MASTTVAGPRSASPAAYTPAPQSNGTRPFSLGSAPYARSASASGWGWDVLRVIPPAVLTGQAAGIAAALALDEQKPVYDAPVSAIQKVLADTGVIIHFDDAWVPTDQTADTFAQTEGHL